MKLYNLLEEEVINAVNNFTGEIGATCNCDKCKLDIAAIALNNLKPKYVVTEEGKLYGRINNMSYQFNTNVVMEVTRAMSVVGKKPQHEI